ncbi:MAG: SMC-Scp complex subunit ScpB [Candidatus Micrarchaeota archaeon]
MAQDADITNEVTPKGTLLAALYIANRPVALEELSKAVNLGEADVEGLVAELNDDFKKSDLPFEVAVFEDPAKLAGSQVKLEITGAYLQRVSSFSKQIEFGKKAQKILALIAKKKELLQSELKYYFKGDIYDAVQELVDLKYLQWEKYKNTKKLKPTKLFFEKFKMVD